MKTFMRNHIVLLLLAVSSWGCTSTKSIYSGENNVLIGGVQAKEITGAEFQVKPSFFTKSVTFSPVPAGVAWGLTEGKDLEYKDDKTGKTEKLGEAGGAVLGALGGFVGMYIFKAAAPKAKTLRVMTDQTDKWLQKRSDFKHSYLLADVKTVDDRHVDGLILLPKNAQNQFTASNAKEVQYYKTAFGQTASSDEFIKRSIARCDDDGLFALMEQFPSTPYLSSIKKQYVLNSSTYSMLVDRQKQYPVLPQNDLQDKASKLVNNIGDYKDYKTQFTSTKFDDYIFSKIYKNLSITDLHYLIIYQPTASKMHEARLALIEKINDIDYLVKLEKEYGSGYRNTIEKQAEQIVYSDRRQLATFKKYFPDSKRLLVYNSITYLGDFNSATKQPEGQGVYWNESEDLYRIGEFSHGKLSGNNCKVYAKNYTYEGGMRNGEKSGHGELSYSGGWRYIGDFRDDKMYGQGKYWGDLNRICSLSSTGDYEGSFADNMAHGQGVLSFEDEQWYNGGFKNGDFDGIGIIRFSNGVRCQGPWKEHNPNGRFHIFKYTLLGLVQEDHYQVAHNWDELLQGQSILVKQWNSRGASSETSSNKTCYELLDVPTDKIPTFYFSGYEYKPLVDHVYKLKCSGESKGYVVYLSYDTKAKEWLFNNNYSAGWYYYKEKFIGNDKSAFGSKTKTDAAKERCDCN